MEYRLLSLNDTQELHRMRVGDREYVFTGAARGKAGFAVAAMKAARRSAKLVLAAHPESCAHRAVHGLGGADG